MGGQSERGDEVREQMKRDYAATGLEWLGDGCTEERLAQEKQKAAA